MPAQPAINPPAQAESKAAKKKRGKSEVTLTTSGIASSLSNPDTPTTEAPTNEVDGVLDSVFVKELQKSLRNAVKKLNATAKVDSIIAENPGLSLDELVAAKKINADQKAQALKKPALQATIAQIEDQLKNYRILGEHYEERLASQKTALENAKKEGLEAERKKVAAEITEASNAEFRDKLLTLSRFLRAAAAMRRSGDEVSSESRAFEGALFQVYGGTEEAVDAMIKLIEGAEEPIPSVDTEPLDVTYLRVKQASLEYAPEGWTEGAPASEAAPAVETVPATDPTVANAGLTEAADALQPAVNGYSDETQQLESVAPLQTAATNGAANVLAESAWNPPAMGSLTSAAADGWVEVERNPSETDTGVQATPAAVPNTNSWAEDVPTQTPATINSKNGEANDGFEQVVHHHQRQGSGRGRNFRGRGPPRGDGFRGRGAFRGDRGGRGRGSRGELRGGRGRGGQAGSPKTAPGGN